MCVFTIKVKSVNFFPAKVIFFNLVSFDRVITVTVLSNGSEVEEAQIYTFEWEDTRPIEVNQFPLQGYLLK